MDLLRAVKVSHSPRREVAFCRAAVRAAKVSDVPWTGR